MMIGLKILIGLLLVVFLGGLGWAAAPWRKIRREMIAAGELRNDVAAE